MIRPIILAGGVGSRLWPLSSDDLPKQFISINNEISLFQKTILRFSSEAYHEPLIITNSNFYAIVEEQLNHIDKASSLILLEQIQKNTCPAILISLLSIENDEDILVVPSDHLFEDDLVFNKNILSAKEFINDNIVIFGINPTEPNTGYGYLHLKEPKNGNNITSFIEKPSINNAQKYIESGEYFWNSGLILAKKSLLLDQIQKYCPEIVDFCLNAHQILQENKHSKLIDINAMKDCPSISIDYGVLEKTKEIVFFEIETDWNDMGSWDSFYKKLPKDSNNNYISGNVINLGTKNSLIISEDKIVSSIGLENIVIIDTAAGLLVSDIRETQNIKSLKLMIDDIDADKNIIGLTNRRPWGNYVTIFKGENFQLKLISVNIGHKLSVQKHFKRAEHWIVVRGQATVEIDEAILTLELNEHCYIPKESIHSLENKKNELLQIIELQYGSYLGEDDIVRYDDRYGRIKD